MRKGYHTAPSIPYALLYQVLSNPLIVLHLEIIPLATKYLQGVFATRPALPRYNRIWDVSLVLKYIKSLGENENLTLQNLTLKTTMLLALVSGQRCQTLHALNVQNMALDDNMCTFRIAELLKTTRPGRHLGHVELKAYNDDSCLCVVTALQQYMVVTTPLRNGNNQLLLSYQKPHKPVSTETIGKWIKKVLSQAGINIEFFGAHSTRAASTSAAKAANVPISIIMDAAGWSTSRTFSKFYDKPIATEENIKNFGHSVLNTITVE